MQEAPLHSLLRACMLLVRCGLIGRAVYGEFLEERRPPIQNLSVERLIEKVETLSTPVTVESQSGSLSGTDRVLKTHSVSIHRETWWDVRADPPVLIGLTFQNFLDDPP